MKCSFLQTALVVLVLLAAPAALPLVRAQGYVPIPFPPCPYLSQYTVTNWVDALDLDSDGQPEFLHWSFDAYQYCAQSQTQTNPDLFTDYTEALFPTERVQVYVELQPPRVFISPVLTNAQAVLPEPNTGGPSDLFWEWNAPEATAWLNIVGLGVGTRCWSIAGFPPPYHYSSYGYLNGPSTNYLFGFRVSRHDGWHLAWLRLTPLPQAIWRPSGGWQGVALLEYDIHPEPNTEIRAGEYAQPRLQVRRDGDQVVVSWPADYRTCTLERATRLDPPNWLPGPPTTTNIVVFDASDAPWYFRLKR